MDPIKMSNGSSGNGFTELASIYDAMVRYNAATGNFEWRTGTFTPSSDYQTWTLAVKPGIKFQDGTDYDAAAVAFHMQRIQGPDATSGSKLLLLSFVESTTVTDPLTVVFKLKAPWTGFPTLFTKEVGLIPSPTQVKARGANFGINPGPAGAGPFSFVSYQQGESLILQRNPTYWGTKAPLDGIQFQVVGGGDPTIMFEQLQQGGIHLMVTRDLPTIERAKATKSLSVNEVTLPADSVILINSFMPSTRRSSTQGHITVC
jgi:peptide/nickel transport system substrate-binding protein